MNNLEESWGNEIWSIINAGGDIDNVKDLLKCYYEEKRSLQGITVVNKRMFSREVVIDLLRSIQQVVSPKMYKSSQYLDSFDFLDLPSCKATALGITENELWYDDENYIGDEV